MATIQDRIEAISFILASGVDRAVIDGSEVSYDLEALAKERDRLLVELSKSGRRGPITRRGIYNPAFGDG